MKKLKLRYYLRGLGIGMLVTAFILGIAGGDEAEMTDAQIRERAIELGMVDSGSIMLSDLRENHTEESEATTEEDEPVESTDSTPEPTEESTESTEETEPMEPMESTDPIEPTETEASLEVVTITIYAGSGSYTVSKDLEDAGLVEDAGDFDDYLCNMGYSKIVRTGTYKITVGTSEEEIAKIITGKR